MIDDERYAMNDSYGDRMDFTDEQKRCVDYDSDSFLVIKGTAGSGKSMMVIKRAKEYREDIISRRAKETICLMTYTKTLAQGIRDVLEKNGIAIKSSWSISGDNYSGDGDIRADEYISVTHVDQYLTRLCKAMKTLHETDCTTQNWGYSYSAKKVVNYKTCRPDDRIGMVKAVLSKLSAEKDHPYYHRSPQFWADEIQWMYQNGIVDDDDKAEYMGIPREGRCKKYNIHMGRSGREIAFRIFIEYNRLLVKNDLTEWDREYALLYREFGDQIPRSYKFDYLLIDEAQDLSLIKMKLLVKLCRGRMDIAMDKNQSIYGHRWSFRKDLGFTPHVKKLSVMFRGTYEIDLFSSDLKKIDDTLLEAEDIYENETSNIHGPLPKIVRCVDPASEMDFIVNEIETLLENPKSNVAILCPDWYHLRQFEPLLKKKGIDWQFFNDDGFKPLTPGVKLITTYSAKGLGFYNVIVPYFEDGVYPVSAESVINSLVQNQDSSSEAIDYDDAIAEEISGSRRLIYVAITRARANVLLTYSGKPSRFANEFESSHYKLIDESHEVVTDSRIAFVGDRAPAVSPNYEQNQHQPSTAQRDEAPVGVEEPIATLIANRLAFIDKRSKNGVLWVIDEGAATSVIKELRLKGYNFKYAERGSRSTDHRPAYYYEG